MKAVYRFFVTQSVVSPELARRSLPRYFDIRAIHVAILLGLLALLNLVDLFCTLFAYHLGMLNEVNPLASAFLVAGLEPSFISYKLLLVLAGSTMLWKLRRTGWTIPACWLLISAYAALSVVWYLWVQDITPALGPLASR